MFGPSSNMEVTYMGGNEWDRIVSVDSDPAGSETLYSLISGFGTSPNGGFDDTDRSVNQTLRGESKFPAGNGITVVVRWGSTDVSKSSWLVGLRYVRFDSTLNYSTRGALNNSQSSNLPRFFSSNDRVKNNIFGPQAGVDLWWNVRPGINLGVGVKGAWVQNDSKRQTIMTSNSLSGFATPGTVILEETRRKGTVLGELEATAIYRLSHSWSVKASYHLLAADDVIFGSVDVPSARDFVNNAATIREPGSRETHWWFRSDNWCRNTCGRHDSNRRRRQHLDATTSPELKEEERSSKLIHCDRPLCRSAQPEGKQKVPAGTLPDAGGDSAGSARSAQDRATDC